MADAWTELVGGSTLPVAPGNDAWDHLLAQGGTGGGTGVDRYVLANIAVAVDDIAEDIEVRASAVGGTLTAGRDIQVEVEVQEVSNAIDITVDVLDIDNPDEVEV
jgi:hypothetical protein